MIDTDGSSSPIKVDSGKCWLTGSWCFIRALALNFQHGWCYTRLWFFPHTYTWHRRSLTLPGWEELGVGGCHWNRYHITVVSLGLGGIFMDPMCTIGPSLSFGWIEMVHPVVRTRPRSQLSGWGGPTFEEATSENRCKGEAWGRGEGTIGGEEKERRYASDSVSYNRFLESLHV